METLRYNCIVPFSVTHRAKSTFQIRGKYSEHHMFQFVNNIIYTTIDWSEGI